MSILSEKRTWKRQPDKKRPLSLSHDEQQNVRRAVRYLNVKLGSSKALAAAMKMNQGALQKAMSPGRLPGMRLAVAAAYVAGVSVDDVLSGAWPVAGACPYCGRR